MTDKDSLQAEHDALVAEAERQRRMYETALNSTPDFVYIFDLEHRALYANAALLRTWGVDDVRGKRWTDLGYEQWHADLHDRELDQVISTGAPIRGEIPFTGTNGRRVYDYIFAPVLGADGKVVAVAGTTRDITERQAAEQALREQSLQLAASDRAKDEFLATLAHELRNPLAPLSNAIELCKRASDDRSLTHSAYVLMERQVRHLIRLVDDLMEVSRISRGAFTLRRERVEAAALVRTAVETSEPLIQAAGHELTIKLPSEPLWLDGDAVRLAQVISNLLNNAALYTDPGGRLRVTVQREGSEAVFGVADNGIGIDPDALPQLFEMFTRGSDSTRHRGGLGLGLPLSLRLAQLHGGTVQAHSAGPGCGSEFTLRVPAVADSPGAYVPADLRTQALPGMRVLVVDDNRDAADSLSLLLHLLGADARTVHGAREGLTLFDDWRPDAVLLDIGMPDMDGYDMARAIRQRAGGRSVRLVALTGWGQDDVRRKTKEAGIDHHLVKPAQIEALVQILRADQRG